MVLFVNCSKCGSGVLEAVGESVVIPKMQKHEHLYIECPVTMYVCSLDICSHVEFVAHKDFLSDTKKLIGSNRLSSI